MPEITSLFNLSADGSAQQPVNASSNAGANPNGFATQLATAMGQGEDASPAAQKTTGGKNIPLSMTTSATNTNPDANAAPNTEAEAASGNINPLMLAAPVIFSEPIELAAAEPANADSAAAQQMPTPQAPLVAQPAQANAAAAQSQQAIDPSGLIPLNKQPMGISQTAEDYISGLVVTKPDLGGSAAIVLPDASTQAQAQTQTPQAANLPFVPAAKPTVKTEPVRLQFNDPIILAAASEPVVDPNYPKAGGMKAVTPSEDPLYLSSLIPANRAAAAASAQPEEAEQPEQLAAAPVADTAPAEDAAVSEAATSTEDVATLWDSIKLVAGDIKQSLAGPSAESAATIAEPLLVANTFHEPLKMTATVGKPMTETAKLGYNIAPAATASSETDAANAETEAAPANIQASIEGTADTTEANPQPYVEIKTILPEQFEQRTMDYMKRNIAADAMVQNNSGEARPLNDARPQNAAQNSEAVRGSVAGLVDSAGDDMAGGKEGQASQNQQNPQNSKEQQARPNVQLPPAAVEIAQTPQAKQAIAEAQAQAAAKPAEPAKVMADANVTTSAQPQAELASASSHLAPASEQVTVKEQPKQAINPANSAEHNQRQNIEPAFQPSEQSEPKQVKAEERVLRWESAKDAVNLAKLVQQAGQNGVTKLTVRLTPENLGRLEIQLTEIGGRIDAKIMANSTESRALLASNGEAIRQQLADKGIQINNMDFSFHDSLARQDQNDHGRGAGQDAKQGRFNLAKGDKADFEQAMAQEQEEVDSNAIYA